MLLSFAKREPEPQHWPHGSRPVRSLSWLGLARPEVQG